MLPQTLEYFSLTSILDIIIVAYVLYRLMLIIRGTRAVQLIKGLVVLLVGTALSELLGLETFNWILEKVQTVLIVALPIVFQPELRRALEQLGRGKFITRPITVMGDEDVEKIVDDLVKAVRVFSKNSMGALLIIERETGLNDYIETGVKIDGLISSEFLVNVFINKTPLHDGAVIIRGDRVAAAGCFLPLSENPNLSKEIGTRHRAGIGITEQSDAVAIIVSEETGVISVAEEGKLTRFLDDLTLKELLLKRLQKNTQSGTHLFNWRF